ncbi:MAG: group 1 truncated hemoglobin [Bdellovibrionaceae bacterium]|nr:group 1 truncated hemoglobin [Pseudobdellovibrionaceae bacterium]
MKKQMLTKQILALFLFASLIGCAQTPDAEDGAAESGDVAEETAGDEEGLSDEPMSEDGGETAASEDAAPADEAAPATPEVEKSLFDRIGGKGKLQQFVDKFVNAMAANTDLQKNTTLASAFKGDQARHKQMLVDYFCANTGGPCTYGGKPLKEAHGSMKVSKADWNVMRKVFIHTLREMKVPKKERMDLALVAARQKKYIVQ